VIGLDEPKTPLEVPLVLGIARDKGVRPTSPRRPAGGGSARPSRGEPLAPRSRIPGASCFIIQVEIRSPPTRRESSGRSPAYHTAGKCRGNRLHPACGCLWTFKPGGAFFSLRSLSCRRQGELHECVRAAHPNARAVAAPPHTRPAGVVKSASVIIHLLKSNPAVPNPRHRSVGRRNIMPQKQFLSIYLSKQTNCGAALGRAPGCSPLPPPVRRRGRLNSDLHINPSPVSRESSQSRVRTRQMEPPFFSSCASPPTSGGAPGPQSHHRSVAPGVPAFRGPYRRVTKRWGLHHW